VRIQINYLAKYLLLTFIVLLLTACSSKNISKNAKYSDKYRLVWNGNPMTSMTIAWNQYQGKPSLYYGLDKAVTKRILPYRTTQYRGMHNQFVKLENLKANSRYYFKVCTNQKCSELMYFKTAPLDDQAFTFIAGGLT